MKGSKFGWGMLLTQPQLSKRRYRWMVLVGYVSVLVGCSSLQVRYPDGSIERKTRAEFETYVEGVFRYHNRVVNDLIVASSMLDDDFADLDPLLVRAEETMASECRPLNDTVSATIEGREIGFFQKLRLPQTVPACEVATRDLEALLPSI